LVPLSQFPFSDFLIKGVVVARSGMTDAPSRTHDPGVVSPGLVHRGTADRDTATRISNRIRGLLTGIHPALERAIGPSGIAKAGRRKLTAIAKAVAEQVEGILDAHPLAGVLTSMPGIGVRTAARILLEVGDATGFKSSGHLAAHAGIAPVTRSSGTSIKGEHPARTGNRKRAFFLAAFAALHDPTGRAYYDRKRAEGKKHNARR
jgi:transposase